MEHQTPTPSFEQVVKHPLVYSYTVVMFILMFFVYAYKGSNDSAREACEKRNKELERQNQRLINTALEARREADSNAIKLFESIKKVANDIK